MKKTIILEITMFLCAIISNVNAQDSRTWSTYYGGSGWEDSQFNDVATDPSGNVYMVSATPSNASISTLNSYGGGASDGYIVKFDPTGNRVWSRYYGFTGDDYLTGIAIDASGDLYISGSTNSPSSQAFVLKMNSAGTVVWQTYFGGSGSEGGYGVDIDGLGNVYLAGQTTSTSGLAVGGFQMSNAGGAELFLAKFNSSGVLTWATYYGGSSNDFSSTSSPVKVDAANNVYLCGSTYSTSGIASGGFQNTNAGGMDALLVKFDAAGNRLWATYYGGTGDEDYNSITTDQSNNVFIAGRTPSTTGMSSIGSFQNVFGGGGIDGYLVKFDVAGNRLWATYYGGTSGDFSGNVTTDATGSIYMVGNSSSTSGISYLGFQNSLVASNDAFLVKFDASGNRTCATYFGASSSELGMSAALDLTGNIYMSGYTASTTGISYGGFQMTYGGGTFDHFLVKFTNYCPLAATPGTISGTTTICSGSSNIYSVSAVAGATSYTWTLPGGWTGTSTTNSITATASATSGNITVTANNTCGNSTAATLAVTVNTIPATPSSILGTTTICSGSSNTYSVSAVAGATSYTWTLPGGWTGSSTTNSITATANTTSGNITVTANNTCGNSTASTLAITVNTIPATPGTISGLASMCIGTGAQTYSITAIGGATSYTWTLPATWSGTSTTTSIVATPGTSGGNITVTANNTCGNSSPQTLAVIINPLPTVTYSQSPALVCVNATSVALGTASPTGGTFTGTSVTGSTFNASTAGIGTFTITYTYTDGNGCVNAANSNITVDPCTDIQQQSTNNQQLIVFPNPTSSIVKLSGLENEARIEVINVLGETILSTQTQNTSVDLNLSEFEIGIYFIKVSSDTGTITKRIIKQ